MSGLLGLILANALASGLLALLAWALSRRIRRRALVHGLWVLALVKLVTPPILPLAFLPEWELPSLALPAEPAPVVVELTASTSPAAARGDGASASPLTEPAPGRTRAPRTAVESARPARISGMTSTAAALQTPAPGLLESQTTRKLLDLPSLAWAGLLLGALLVASLAALRVLRFRRLLRLAAPAPPSLSERLSELAVRIGLRRAPPVRLLPARVPPMLWPTAGGPLLLLPAALLPDLSDEERDTLLVHELAHVRRRDHWVRLVELAATTLFWWYPVTWWVRRALRRAEERCCDEWVLRVMPDSAPAYAQGLLKSLDLLLGEPHPLPVGASGAGPVGDLESRLKEIVMTTRPTPPLAAPARIALALAALLGLAVFPTQAQSPAPDEAPAAVPPVAVANPVPPAAPAPPQAAPSPLVPAPAVPAPLVAGARPAPAAPTPAPRPIVAPAPAPRPVVAPDEPREDEAALRAFEEQQQVLQEQLLGLQARRNELRRKELTLASQRMTREAAARQERARAEIEHLRQAGETERAAKVQEHARAMAARMDVRRREIELEKTRLEEQQENETALHSKAAELRALERDGREREAAALRTELARLEREHVQRDLVHEERQTALQREVIEVEHRAREAELEMEMAAHEDVDIEIELQRQRMEVEQGLHEQELEIREAEQAARARELEAMEHESAGRHEAAEAAGAEAERMRQDVEASRHRLHEERLLRATGDLELQMEGQLAALRDLRSVGAGDGAEVERRIERLEAALAALRR